MNGDRISVHPEAASELEAGLAWYAARSAKAAEELLLEFDHALIVILKAPESWQQVIGPWRRYPLRRFPFLIYFRKKIRGSKSSRWLTRDDDPAIGGIAIIGRWCCATLIMSP